MKEALADITVGDVMIPRREIDLSFDRSSGPGGQNVNKVNTKVTMKWHVPSSVAWADREDAMMRFMDMNRNQINKDGFLVLQCQDTRSQSGNIWACVDKFTKLVSTALTPPVERIATVPSQGSQQRRMDKKAQRGRRKKERQWRYKEDQE